MRAADDDRADVARRPTLLDADLDRVRDLRLSRLKQSSLTATAAADRTLLSAVFGTHPYGHGALGTSRSISAVRADDVRQFWASAWLADRVTVIVCGDVPSGDAQATTTDPRCPRAERRATDRQPEEP